jgi:hypothetical protein
MRSGGKGWIAGALAVVTAVVGGTLTVGARSSAPASAFFDPVTGVGATSGERYWTVTASGAVTAQGRAAHHGDLRGTRLNAPVTGIFATANGNGYWLLGRDGGIFSFGDARFLGSTGGLALRQPIVGMAATPTGRGYWLVASDGGVFAFGDARFLGSTGGLALRQPIVGMAAKDGGYLLVARDGGVFAFGGARFSGSMASTPGFVAAGIAPLTDGYAVVGLDGRVHRIGRAGVSTVPVGAPAPPSGVSSRRPRGAADDGRWGAPVWHDEFTSAGLDRARWYPNRWFADTCSFGANPNTELQSYWADNVVQPGDGRLHLVAKREARPCAENHWSGTKPFTSGWVQTGGANADSDVAPGFTCAGECYWEVTVKMPRGGVLFPAVWLMPVTGSTYPTRPEIDMVEFWTTYSQWEHHVHFDCVDQGLQPHWDGPDAADGDWHRIGVWVEPGRRVRWYVDGTPSWTYSGCGVPAAAQQMYLILNLAVGGEAPLPSAGEPFPKTMLVDSVYVWKR